MQNASFFVNLIPNAITLTVGNRNREVPGSTSGPVSGLTNKKKKLVLNILV